MTSAILIKPSLTMRIGIGKLLGFIFGLLGFLTLPLLDANTDFSFRLGILFWYSTVGAIIGVYGVYTRHPVLKIPMPWWFRAPVIGAWMNFVLTLFIQQDIQSIMVSVTGITDGALVSPYWFVLEGAIVGLIIGWMATKYAGEGPESAVH